MSDEQYMQRCLDLAENGLGLVAPNPMVGCVVVHEGLIIGEGYHHEYGGPHAEVVAVNSVKDQSLLSASTVYVSLEPCAHEGKTPPCADLLINHNVAKVVVGCRDPFAEVDGKGIDRLRSAGIEVVISSLEKECIHLNRRFFTFHQKQRPYIILKWAKTKDGFIDKHRTENEQGINWITDPFTKSITHAWRGQEEAILVGRKTVEIDNPSLTVREASGTNPIRVVIDPDLKLDRDQHIFNEEAKTIVLNSSIDEITDHIELVRINFEAFENEFCKTLFERNIQSIIIEGGANTLDQFIKLNLWDEARILTGDAYFGSGQQAPQIGTIPTKESYIGNDLIAIHFNA